MMRETVSTLVLSRLDVAELLGTEECLAAVEAAFRLYAEGRLPAPSVAHVDGVDGIFHIKAAGLAAPRPLAAVKINGNFPQNGRRFGLPTIQGLIVLCDGVTGIPLSVMDSIEITIRRTGAATAVAAKLLARPESRIVTICGCGSQGRIHLEALKHVFPALSTAYAFDVDENRAKRFAAEASGELLIEAIPTSGLAGAVRASDICITCTTAQRFFLRRDFVSPGTFVGAVGADSPEKQELDPLLLKSSTVVVDILEQAAAMGELHHALREQIMTTADVHAELGEVIAGRKPGRTSRDEITVFDSTGTALQDAAVASVVYEKAIARGTGRFVDF